MLCPFLPKPPPDASRLHFLIFTGEAGRKYFDVLPDRADGNRTEGRFRPLIAWRAGSCAGGLLVRVGQPLKPLLDKLSIPFFGDGLTEHVIKFFGERAAYLGMRLHRPTHHDF